MKQFRKASWLFTAAMALSPAPAMAAMPDAVRAMIDAAIATGDPAQVKTVVTLAKQTNAADGAEIDALNQTFLDRQASLAAAEAARKDASIRSAGLLDNWHGRGEIGASRSTGNSSTTGLTAGLGLERTGIRWRHKLRALADYQRSNGVTTREQFLFAYEPNFQITNRLFVYGLGQYERDRFQGFSSRLTASSGFGYRVIDNDRMHLAVKAGPAWRRTKFIPTGSSSNLAGMAALDFDWRLSQRLKLTENASAYIESGNKSFVSSTGLEAALSDKLSARFSYTVETDTNPPPGAVKTDTLTRFTLIYGF